MTSLLTLAGAAGSSNDLNGLFTNGSCARRFLAARQALLEATATSTPLSQARFERGIASHLVFDSQCSVYIAQHGLTDAQLQERTTTPTLYERWRLAGVGGSRRGGSGLQCRPFAGLA